MLEPHLEPMRTNRKKQNHCRMFQNIASDRDTKFHNVSIVISVHMVGFVVTLRRYIYAYIVCHCAQRSEHTN